MPLQARFDTVVEQIRADGDTDGAAHGAGLRDGAHGDGAVVRRGDEVDAHDEGADTEAEAEAHEDFVAVLRGGASVGGGGEGAHEGETEDLQARGGEEGVYGWDAFLLCYYAGDDGGQGEGHHEG